MLVIKVKEKEYIVVHETTYQSIISDLFSISYIICAMALNYTFFGNSIFWNIVFVILLLMTWIVRSDSKSETFKSPEDAIKFIRSNLM